MTLGELIAEARLLADDSKQPGTAISIDSIATGNPATITAERHGLVTGQTATIAGRTGDTPTVNGDRVVTVIDADTLTVPINLTVSGTGGTISGTDEDSLWSDAEWTRYANLTEQDAARRCLCLQDNTTDEDANSLPICEIAITADPSTSEYQISPLVLTIRHAQLASLNYPLVKDKMFGLANENLANIPSGTPSMWSWAIRKDYIVLNRLATASDTLKLVVTRLPLVDMSATGDEPEIPEQYHYYLVYGMLARAYLKKDSETYDPNASARMEAEFSNHFGPPVSAQQLEVKRRADGRTQYIKHF